MDNQLRLEEFCLDRTVQRYGQGKAKQIANERETETAYGRLLLSQLQPEVETAISAWIQAVKRKRGAGYAHASAELITKIPASVASVLVCKAVLDTMSKPTSYSSVAMTIGKALEDEVSLRAMHKKFPNEFVKLERHLYTSRSRDKQLRAFYKAFADKTGYHRQLWSNQDKLKLGLVCLELFLSTVGGTLVETGHSYTKARHKRRMLYPSDKLVEYIAEADAKLSVARPIHLPMVERPVSYTEDSQAGGYLTRPLDLSKDSTAGFLKVLPGSCAIDAVNAVQDTEWQVNKRVLDVAEYFWTHGLDILPNREPLPLPTKPSDINTNKEARQQYGRDKAKTIAHNYASKSKRFSVAQTLRTARQFSKYPSIWLPQQLDFRGRMYTVPWYLSNQGTDLSKSLLRFATGKPVNDEAMDWLKIHGANLYGLDKRPYKERIKWVNENLSLVQDISNDPLSNLTWTEADKPWQFLAFCFDFSEVLLGRDSYIPCAVDGSQHGFQIWALLLRDQTTAARVNCVPGDIPTDLYTELADKTKDLLSDCYYGRSLAACGIDRSLMKKPAMATAYGCSFTGLVEIFLQELWDRRAAGEKYPWDSDHQAARVLGTAFDKALRVLTPAIVEGLDWLRQVALLSAQQNKKLFYTTPATTSCGLSYKKHNMKQIKTKLHGSYKSAVLIEEADSVCWRRQQRAIGANYTHSLDAALMMRTVASASRQGVTHFSMVHDSYGTHAADLPKIQQLVRSEAVDIFGSRSLLTDLHDEFSRQLGSVPTPPEIGSYDVNDLATSKYFFQ